MDKKYYVNIPRDVFTEENKLSNEEIVICLLLYRYKTVRNSFIFTINILMEHLRVSLKQTKTKEKIKRILLSIQKKEIFKIYFNDKKINKMNDFLFNTGEIHYAYLKNRHALS